MNKKPLLNEIHTPCKECGGNGYITGTISNNQARCLFCNGDGNSNHGPRISTDIFTTMVKWCEDYIDGKKEGWYH